MLLSIGMIMKNEERFLRDCLTAIKPVLDNVDSELIICDTGSTDNSIAIAKEFTDNVFEIGWRDDFAWARQQGFKRSKGEWYWYLDTDEIFQNVDDIIDFFNSGTYKEFGTATVKIDNNPDSPEVAIFEAVRLFKIIEGMQWEYKIHEQLIPHAPPTKYLNSVCLHYGYKLDEKGFAQKRKRNLVPILEIYEKDPNNYRNIVHLLQEYTGKPEQQLEYAKKALALAKTAELHEEYAIAPYYYPTFVQTLTQIYCELSEYEKIIDCVAEYFDSVPVAKLAANSHYLRYQQAFALIQTDKADEAKEIALLAYELKKQADNDELDKRVLSTSILPRMVDNDFIVQILETFVLNNLFDDAIKWLENLPNARTVKETTYEIDKYICYEHFVGLMFLHKPKMLGNLYWHFANKQNAKEYNDIITIIEMGIQSESAKIKLAKTILEKANSYDMPYIQLQQLRLALEKNDSTAVDYLDYFMKQDNLSQIYADVLVVAIKHNKFFAELSNKMDIVTSMNLFERTVDAPNSLWKIVATNDILSDLDTVHNFLQKNNFMKDFTDIKAVRFMCDILNNLISTIGLFDGDDTLKKDEISKQLLLFELLAKIFNKHYKMLYSAEIYCENAIHSLTDAEIVIFYLGTAYEHKETGNIADFAKYMRLALKTAPQYKESIQKITDNLQENLAPPTVHEQLQQEIANLKAVIYNMIQTGNKTQAQQIFETYVQINPTDDDIAKIRKMLA
ncbi:MAG: glycosyltransferase [Firmicutes bacterium]|nr:glycosyltransferase [Bacillota bacterium]